MARPVARLAGAAALGPVTRAAVRAIPLMVMWVAPQVVASQVIAPQVVAGQDLRLPNRPANAPGGRAVAADVRSLDLREREERLLAEILAGNVPSWLRTLRPVEVTRSRNGDTTTVRLAVAPDYLAVGSDLDWFLVPLTPRSAQIVADATGTSLPTVPVVDAIWARADVRLGPDSLPPGPGMTTVPWFEEHDRRVRERRIRSGAALGSLVSGHKKDVVLTPRLSERPGHVAIYGWHRPNGVPIQPLYTGHTDDWADYSHGVRLVSRTVWVDGVEYDLIELLEDPGRSWLLEDDGPIRPARYR